SIGAIGYPLATGLAATVLRDVARKAEHARRSAEEERTAAKAEAERAAAGQRRYSDLSVTAVPLLRGFAHGTLDPEDPEVQKRCW
ncbi:histidine kinase, partial [Saccharothrix algeriensis]